MGYKILPLNSWKKLDLRKIRLFKVLGQQESQFWDSHLGVLGKKWHLDVVPIERHKIHYREGSGASSQRLWVVWSLCLRLSLLSFLNHFHSICINCPLFLVVQVDIMLNFHVWVHLRPILELQHTFLPLKCCELGNMPQLYYFFVVSF